MNLMGGAGYLNIWNVKNTMAKLYFRYGSVGSAKSLNLLAVAHKYESQHKRVLACKPSMDTRNVDIYSRAGHLSRPVDILIGSDNWDNRLFSELETVPSPISCILIDEAQFMTAEEVERFRKITIFYDIPVICYGLRIDWKTEAFEGSKRLMELADSIEEIKTTCFYCNKKAGFGIKLKDGERVRKGESIGMGFEETYLPVCYGCYLKL